MQHPKLSFSSENYEFIKAMLDSNRILPILSNCRKLYHPSETCFQYKIVKMKIALRNAIIVHAIATLIPALIRNRKKLATEFKLTVKEILKTFFKSVTWLTLLCFLPAVSMCHVIKFSGSLTKTAVLVCFAVG